MAKQVKTISAPWGQVSNNYRNIIINDSEAILKGSFVRLTGGGVEAIDNVADDIYGICRGYVQKPQGVVGSITGRMPLENVDADNYDGTLVTTVGSESYTATADNTSAAEEKVYALIEPVLPGCVYRVQLDDTRDTESGTVGYQISTTTGIQLDESTGHATNPLQFIIIGVPEDEADVVDVLVRENQAAGVSA